MDTKEYYEAQLQKKILFIPNLSNFLEKLNEQVLKLPHEMVQGNLNEPIGTKYDDIVLSFCNGVDVAYSNLAPIRKLFEEYTEYKEPAEVAKLSDFKRALRKLEWIYCLLDKADVLNDNVRGAELPDIGEDFDDSLIVEEDDVDEPNEQDVPAPEQKGDDRTLGVLEKEKQRPLAKENLAPSISQ